MVSESGIAIWQQRGEPERQGYPALGGDLKVDAVIVGAGITGLSAALHLQELGTRVAVVEMDRVGAGTTGASTGHLDVLPDGGLSALIDGVGLEAARQAVAARQAAIGQVEHWCRALALPCQFRRVPGYLYVEPDQPGELLERELAAAKRVELLAEMRSRAPLPFETGPALRVAYQGRLDPAAYARGLAAAVVQRGGRVFERTRLERIERGQRGQAIAAVTDRGVITGEAIALAGHGPMLGLLSSEARVSAWNSYVLAARVAEPVADALYWDMAKAYHYTRILNARESDLLIVGGADHPTGQQPGEDPLAELERYVRQRYAVRGIEARWSGVLWQPADGLPYVGPVPGSAGVSIATGFAGEGLSYGTAAGLLLGDQMLGRENAWAWVFDPARVRAGASGRQMLWQMVQVARHYVGDRLGRAELGDVEQVQRGQGALVSVAGRKLAVYRDEAGAVHALSPVCRHRGCLVHWNPAERTWDCPCHGGRYDAKGNVIAGPPRQPLVRVSLGAKA